MYITHSPQLSLKYIIPHPINTQLYHLTTPSTHKYITLLPHAILKADLKPK